MRKKFSPFNKLVWILTAVGLAVTVVTALFYFSVFNGSFSSDHLAWGSFGGYLGGVLGPTYSLFAFIGIMFTIFLQGRENAAVRRKESQEAHVRELKYALDAIERRMEKHPDYIDRIIKIDTLTKDLVENWPNWSEVRACFVYMSYCMRELNDALYGAPIANFYQILYGDVVEKLVKMGALHKSVFEPFWEPPQE